MLHRISSAALAVFIAAIFAAAPIGAPPAEAQAERAATSTAANPRDGVRASAADATVQQATTSISCPQSNGRTMTYTLSVRGGSCLAGDLGSLVGNGGTANNASCANTGNGDEASATCRHGCGKTSGQGSCTQTPN